MLMAIDPGRDKCGMIIIGNMEEIHFQQVIETIKLQETVKFLVEKFGIEEIIIGNGTTSRDAQKIITETLQIEIEVVDERNTTEEARKLYWKKNPPKGWRRFLPTSMQVPPVPVDDLVAEILAKRFLAKKKTLTCVAK